MKRWIVKAGATSLQDLVPEDAPLPVPGAGEARVRVRAASLNARDQLLLSGRFGPAGASFVALSDGAGEIDALGPGVGGWAVGDKVTGLYYRSWGDGPPAPGQGWGLGSAGENGMLAEYVVLKAERLTPAPRTLSFEEAACLPCAALTAWTALLGDRPYRRAIGKGDKVLVTGTGSVALFAALFAKAMGATVVATTGDDAKAEQLRALGVAHTLNYKTQANWGELAAARVGGMDRVVNAAGGSALEQSIVALAPGGEIAFMGLFDQAETAPDFISLMMKGASIRGTSVGSAAAYRDMVAFVDTHGIKPPIARIFGLDEARAAFAAAASGASFGKIVVRVGA